jgi:Fatty acid desaturase
VQHQFEHTWWSWEANWNLHTGALHGSSHYDLPPVLRWFTANIGIHYVHHLSSRIPCYRLGEVLREYPELRAVSRLTLKESFRCLRLALCDEDKRRLVGFREARRGWCRDLATTRFALRHRRRPGPPAQRPRSTHLRAAHRRLGTRLTRAPAMPSNKSSASLMQISRADRRLG